MNKMVLLCVALTACTTIETARKNGQELAKQLEAEQDVIEILDKYSLYTKRCNNYVSLSGKGLSEEIEMYIIFAPLLVIRYCLGYDNFFPYHSEREYCYSYDGYAEANTNFDCIDSWRNSDYYNSDECILYRRNLHESKVKYFDYKRFLPINTPINTDEKFLALVKFYNTRFDCDNLENVTTQEKQDCKNKVIKTTVQMATTGVKCIDVYSKEYKEFLDEKGSWFGWAINHDPLATKRMVYYTAGAAAAYWIPEQPVYSRIEALEEITQSVAEWGQEHVCDTIGWQTEIRRMGYNLN